MVTGALGASQVSALSPVDMEKEQESESVITLLLNLVEKYVKEKPAQEETAMITLVLVSKH